MKPLIAIDGPAASGKSTVARALAKKLNFTYVNTGSMYRAFAWLALERKLEPSNRAAVRDLISTIRFECILKNHETTLLLDGLDPDPFLRDKKVNDSVSAISGVPELREFLVNRQRQLRMLDSLVMEGRDIGTVVASDTPYKFFLDASEAIRSARRENQGESDKLAHRDAQDRQRASSPLLRAADAEYVDSSQMNAEQVVAHILGQLKTKGLADVP